jgi:hypothetical protein
MGAAKAYQDGQLGDKKREPHRVKIGQWPAKDFGGPIEAHPELALDLLRR